MKFLIFFLLSFNVFSQEFKSKYVYKLDWRYNEAAIHVSYDRVPFESILSSNFIIVLWETESEKTLNLIPLWNKMAQKLKTQYKMMALNQKDVTTFIRRFKRFIKREILQPKEELESFLNNFEFVVDLDANLAQDAFSDKVPAVIVFKEGKLIKKLYTPPEIIQFMDSQSKK